MACVFALYCRYIYIMIRCTLKIALMLKNTFSMYWDRKTITKKIKIKKLNTQVTLLFIKIQISCTALQPIFKVKFK